jgi:hypothetical protein
MERADSVDENSRWTHLAGASDAFSRSSGFYSPGHSGVSTRGVPTIVKTSTYNTSIRRNDENGIPSLFREGRLFFTEIEVVLASI